MTRNDGQHFYVNGPEITVGIADGSGVTGPVSVVFHTSTRASVGTRGHVNDDAPVVTYRGKEYLANVGVVFTDGEWRALDTREASPSIHKRDINLRFRDSHAAPTVRAAIIAAAVKTVADLAVPHRLEEADYAEAMRHLHTLDEELADAEKKVRELRAARRPFLRTVKAHNELTGRHDA